MTSAYLDTKPHSLTDAQISLARHALGLPNDNRLSYRNRFCAAKGGYAERDWRALVDAGAALRIPWGWGGGDLFFLTLAGARRVLEYRERLDMEDFGA